MHYISHDDGTKKVLNDAIIAIELNKLKELNRSKDFGPFMNYMNLKKLDGLKPLDKSKIISLKKKRAPKLRNNNWKRSLKDLNKLLEKDQ
jgi:hypothetical protein